MLTDFNDIWWEYT